MKGCQVTGHPYAPIAPFPSSTRNRSPRDRPAGRGQAEALQQAGIPTWEFLTRYAFRRGDFDSPSTLLRCLRPGWFRPTNIPVVSGDSCRRRCPSSGEAEAPPDVPVRQVAVCAAMPATPGQAASARGEDAPTRKSTDQRPRSLPPSTPPPRRNQRGLISIDSGNGETKESEYPKDWASR